MHKCDLLQYEQSFNSSQQNKVQLRLYVSIYTITVLRYDFKNF